MYTHPTFSRAVLGGLAGTAAMTAMMYGVAPIMGLHMDVAAMLGGLAGGSWAAGMALHVANGALIFPAIYAAILYDRLPGAPTVKGALWGVALWFVAQTVVMPMMGAGLFSSHMGGPMAVASSLVSHLIYGSLLGAVTGAATLRTATA